MSDDATHDQTETEPETGTTTSSETPPATSEPVTDWRAAFHGGDAEREKFMSQFTDPGDMLTRVQGWRQTVSRSVPVPGPNSSADEIERYRAHFDLPATAADYGLEGVDETGKEFLDGLAKVALDAGVPKKAMKRFVEETQAMVDRITVEQAETSRAAEDQRLEKAVTALKTRWGPEFDANVQYSTAAAKRFELPDALLDTEVGGMKLRHHPDFLGFAAKVGRALLEEADLPTPQADAEDMQKRLEAIDAKASRAYGSERNELIAERRKLLETMTRRGVTIR